MIKWDKSFLSSQSDFVFLKSALALITERAFDLALSNRQVGCRHKTFCCLWWLIRELEALGWIPLLGLGLLVGVRWVEAGRRITLILETAMVCITNWDTRICSVCDPETCQGEITELIVWKSQTHPLLNWGCAHVLMSNSQNPLQWLRLVMQKSAERRRDKKTCVLCQGLSQISVYWIKQCLLLSLCDYIICYFDHSKTWKVNYFDYPMRGKILSVSTMHWALITAYPAGPSPTTPIPSRNHHQFYAWLTNVMTELSKYYNRGAHAGQSW